VSRLPFVWSFSRHRTWQRCSREYWYDYYGSRGGWRSRADPAARELYLLKGLKSVPQWVGIVAHEVAERVLGLVQDGRGFDRESTLEGVQRRARRSVEDALAGLYRLNPKKYDGFLDIEYGSVPSEHWAMAIDDLVEQVDALLEHPVMLRLLEVPDQIVEIERLERVPLGGVPVWVSLDVLVHDGKGRYVVVDWKTGRGGADEVAAMQVALYASYVQRRYGVGRDGVTGLVASTRTGGFREIAYDANMEARARQLVTRSASEMLQHVSDPSHDDAPAEAFPMLPEGDPACANCRYRRASGRE
jgi:hypothetical protein